MLVPVSDLSAQTNEIDSVALTFFQLLIVLTEYSGRKCAGSIDLSFKTMMEAVTTDALEQSFDGALAQVQLIDDTFLLMANSHPFTNRAMEDEDLGPITRPLTGMSNQLGMVRTVISVKRLFKTGVSLFGRH